LKRDYDLKNIIYSEWIEKKREKWLRNASSIKRKKRERVIDNSKELFGVIYEPSKVLYLYGDFIVEFAKTVVVVTLVDKIKKKQITNEFNNSRG